MEEMKKAYLTRQVDKDMEVVKVLPDIPVLAERGYARFRPGH